MLDVDVASGQMLQGQARAERKKMISVLPGQGFTKSSMELEHTVVVKVVIVIVAN